MVKLTTLCENTAMGMGYTGEWGLSVLAESKEETVLLDTGFSDSILRNSVTAGVDLKKINKIVLSHGHSDHTGGLRPLLQKLSKKMDITAHPRVWDKKYTARSTGGSSGYRFIGIPFCKEELEGLGASFSYSKAPVWLNDHMVTTGEIPMVTPFEKIDKNMLIKTEDGFVPDPLLDDRALVIKTGKGLVIILGCAHRGMINTIIHAREITGIEKIYTVIGGTHLIRAGKEQLEQTIAALKDFNVEKLGVSHCTGLPPSAVLASEFGENFFFNNAGNVVEL
ncbi:MAG: MBL fold metallo-hydrolase [Clostridiales bacterium]|nr:MBL fold metallo-hydrolase [Clostridiales bacterium]MCF8023438.1 MBL fold metallo-hydrolase [Clostridiales bacterium]